MTPADFYRDEAARCRQRADRSSTDERAEKWRARAEQYEQLARERDADTMMNATGPSTDATIKP
jgi:hypothetical protein